MRVPALMRDQLVELAEEASRVAGRKVSRAEVHRQITAEGIQRARAAARYAARHAGEPQAPSESA